MSTEGSVSTTSSGIRQFGLYRTIDAKTEEFLRLSRRRQMRQGCACAAISTAITVTIVISITLIYEYSISYESHTKTSLKQNWLNLMNKSAEPIPFEADLKKAKINLDPMYLEFIPLILKTLKKNKYFDKIIEDDSSPNTLFDKEEKPNDLDTKNIFSDSRNWMRIPASRLYTIEYKTSPIVYFKYPTRDADYFTKIRKIRDHQRIMNYVDKMITDKVSFTSTIPISRNAYRFYKKPSPLIFSSTTPIAKVVEYVTRGNAKQKKVLVLKNTSTSKTPKSSSCACPKKLNRLLIKLIRSLQKIIPDFIRSEQMNACNENKFKTVKFEKQILEHESSTVKYEESSKIERSNEILNIISSNFNDTNLKLTKSQTNFEAPVLTANTFQYPTFKYNLSTPNSYQSITKNMFPKSLYANKPMHSNEDYSLRSMNKWTKLNSNQIQQNTQNTPYTTTTTQFIEGTDITYYSSEITTKPMSKIKSTTPKVSANIFTLEDLILQSINLNNLNNFSKLGKIKHEPYNKTTDNVNNFRAFDVQSIKLAKNNKLLLKNRTKVLTNAETELDTLKKYTIPESFNQAKKGYYNNTWQIFKKVTRLPFSTPVFEKITQNSHWASIYSTNADSKPKSTLKSLESFIKEMQLEQQIKSEDVTFEEEIDQSFSEEYTKEDNVRGLENVIHKSNASEINNRTSANKSESETSKLDQYRLLHSEINTDTIFKESKSMIPEKRPTYLEIQRNNYKHDDEHLVVYDYDKNMNLF